MGFGQKLSCSCLAAPSHSSISQHPKHSKAWALWLPWWSGDMLQKEPVITSVPGRMMRPREVAASLQRWVWSVAGALGGSLDGT